jgi:plasmid stabilization system protein ParE
MPHQIEPSRAALADFDAIHDYIARDDPPAAEMLRALDRSIQSLACQPKLGESFVTGSPSLPEQCSTKPRTVV